MEAIQAFQSGGQMDILFSIFVIGVPLVRFALGVVIAVLGIKCMLKYLKNN